VIFMLIWFLGFLHLCGHFLHNSYWHDIHNIFMTPFRLLFCFVSFWCNSDRQMKKCKFLEDQSNEHSYQVWFLLALWFERRFPTENPNLTPLGLLFLMWSSDQPTKHEVFRGPSNKHSYQVWFQLALWIQRRLKFKSFQMTMRS
jgi:hypothetical protein